MVTEWIDSGPRYCDICAPYVEGGPYRGGVMASERPPYHDKCNCKVKEVPDGELDAIYALLQERKEARLQRSKGKRWRYSEDDMSEENENEERIILAGEGIAGAGGVFDVALISAGESTDGRFSFDRAVLSDSLPLWDRAECFVDHDRGNHRSVRDLGGVFHSPRFDEVIGAVMATLKTGGPAGPLVEALGREMLADDEVKPRVGFSADIGITTKGKRVRRITKVFSVDLVFNPARGGAFVRALFSVEAAEGRGEDVAMSAVVETPVVAAGAALDGKEKDVKRDVERVELSEETGELSGLRAQLAQELQLSQQRAAAQCGYLLDSALASAKLPQPVTNRIRAQFAGVFFEPSALTTAIEDGRKLVSELTGGQAVAGVSQVRGMFSSEDQIEAAVDDLLGAPRRAELSSVKVHRLRGIRDLYLGLTGDVDLHGGYYPERAQFATTADFTGLVKNALNKMVVDQWSQLGRAGYDWWNRVSTVEHFDTLQQVTGTLVGTVGALPSVAEGAEYTELVIGDSPETADWTKYGGYIPLTLELIDRDETRKLRQYPRELANSGLRKISALVAGVFTDNSDVGPTMADSGALFNNTAVTSGGGHANLLTTALSASQWDAVCTAVYNQPQLIKNATSYYGTGPKQAVNPKYLLVPRALQLTGMQILYPALERATDIYSQNQQRGEPGDVITVPEWTDANNWAAICDPRILPSIFVGERFGIMPEIFIAGDERSPAVFSNDEHRIKVRHFLAVWVNDFRPLHKSNVA